MARSHAPPTARVEPRRLTARPIRYRNGAPKCPAIKKSETIFQDPSSRALYQIVSSGRFAYHIRKNCEKAIYAQNAVNAKRTVRGYAQAGFAAVMIEDQVSPKRCGHTRGKSVVTREEAVARIRAAVDAREEEADILILARTDARGPEGLEEALWRAEAFSDAGADLLFVEAPTSRDEMREICRRAPGHHLANMLEEGLTPICSEPELEDMGFKLVAHPFALLGPSILAMKRSLAALKEGRAPEETISFEELKETVGFAEYYREEERYAREND